MFSHLFLHGFGARYDLPMSLALYIYGAAGVVVVSFVLVATFASERTSAPSQAYPRLAMPWLAGAFGSRALQIVGGCLGVFSLGAVILTGLAGAPDAIRNPAAYVVWIYLWVGLVVVSGLAGNLWRLLNPFAAIYDFLSLIRSARPPILRLPLKIGIWPAAALFFGIAWLELASGQASVPAVIAACALGYTALTLTGMAIFGRDDWLNQCEVFTVLFGLVSRFSPVEVERGPNGRVCKTWLRWWGTGLLGPIIPGWDRIVFVLLMLSNLAFDGVEATPLWFGIASSQPPIAVVLGGLWRPIIYSLGLLSAALIFLAVFATFVHLVVYFGVTEVDAKAAMTSFAFTLIPIALAYDVAHNYTYLVIQGQTLIPLLGDPLARGWNLLPVRSYQPNLTLASPQTVWLMQVILIVVAHVIAVYLAHRRALQWFHNASNALISQYPMLILMVAYTMSSLWILAQPVTM
jgi:hypothetical protein